MAFYIYCLAYLVIFSHVCVCSQQVVNRISENRRLPSFVLSLGALHLPAEEKQARRAVRGLRESAPPAGVSLQHRRPRVANTPISLADKRPVMGPHTQRPGHGWEGSCLMVTGRGNSAQRESFRNSGFPRHQRHLSKGRRGNTRKLSELNLDQQGKPPSCGILEERDLEGKSQSPNRRHVLNEGEAPSARELP